MVLTFILESAGAWILKISWHMWPFLQSAGAGLQINVVVEDLLLAVQVQEGDWGLDGLRVDQVGGQVSVQGPVTDHTIFQWFSYSLVQSLRLVHCFLLGALRVERLFAVARPEERIQMFSVVGASTQSQICCVFENSLALGITEGRSNIFHSLDGLPALLTH